MTPINPLKLEVGKLYAEYSDAKSLGRIKYFKVVRVLELPSVSKWVDDISTNVRCKCELLMGFTTEQRSGFWVHREIAVVPFNILGVGDHTFSINTDMFELNEKETLNVLAQII